MQLDIRRNADLVIIGLPADFGFYETRAKPLVEKLTELAAGGIPETGERPYTGVLLMQNGPASDAVQPWIDELAREVLLDELVERIEAFRHLLSLVRHAAIPWVYAARDHCFGSHFELAMTCHRRLWFSTEARMGFPEIESGAFPPGGLLEALHDVTSKTRDRWYERPVIDAAFAMAKGRIHFAADASVWRELATSVAAELLRERPKAGLGQSSREPQRVVPDGSHGGGRQAALVELENFGKEVLSQFAKVPTAWEYGWHLIRRKPKLTDSRDLGVLLSRFAARHFLGARFRNWARARLAARDLSRPVPRAGSALPPVMIDLDFLAPPTSALERLLGAGANVVFVAAEAKALAGSLDLVYGRLERRLGAPEAAKLWDRFVTWYQGVGEKTGGCTVRWSVDDRVLIDAEGQGFEIIRLEGNGRDAPPGLCEWPTNLEDNVSQQSVPYRIARLLADGFVRTRPVGPDQLPLSVYLRSLFFEEMLRIAGFREGEPASVTDALKQVGWGFAGDEECWDRFLKTRHDTYRFDEELAELGVQGVSRQGWEIGGWKHAKVLARKRDVEPTRWNDTAVSLHMASFLGMVTRLISRRGFVSQGSDGDLVAAHAVGFPAVYGTPGTFLRSRGLRRVEYYSRRHWPAIDTGWLWEES